VETRTIYWAVPGHVWLYVPAAVAVIVFAYGMWRRLRLIRGGSRGLPFSSVTPRRAWDFVKDALFQRRFWTDHYAGLMHLLILWGMLVLAFGTFVVFLQADLGLPVFRGGFYLWLSLFLDALGVAAIVGVVMAIVRRYILRPSKLDNRGDDAWVLSGLLLVLVMGFCLEGMRMAAVPDEWRAWSPVGWVVSLAFEGASTKSLESAYVVLWWVHLLNACALIAYIPFSKLVHIVTAPLNQALSAEDRPTGGLVPIDFTDETVEVYGIASTAQLGHSDRLALEACTRCGRCQDVCPAHISGKRLTPKRVALDLREWVEGFELRWGLAKRAQSRVDDDGSDTEAAPPGIREADIDDDVIWACTTCGACAKACPVYIKHPPLLVELRQFLVMTEGAIPSEAQLALRNIETNYNPWGIGWAERESWAVNRGVSVASESSEDVLTSGEEGQT